MPQIVRINSLVVAAVTDRIGYFYARNQAEKLSQEHGLTVADMPMVIQAMATHPEVREAIRPVGIDTITAECNGQRDGYPSFEVWHSAGSLATAKGVERLFSIGRNHAFMPISYDEWVAVGKGSYNGQTVARVHLEDIRKGNVPTPGTPYTIFVRLDKYSPKINGRGPLDRDTFMQSDLVLMITGSPDARESLAKMLFGKKEEGGEGRSKIGSHYRIDEVLFGLQAKGCLAYLDGTDFGLGGGSINNIGRFVGVCAGGGEKSASQTIVLPALEELLTVVK